jgi:hypothetical protein
MEWWLTDTTLTDSQNFRLRQLTDSTVVSQLTDTKLTDNQTDRQLQIVALVANWSTDQTDRQVTCETPKDKQSSLFCFIGEKGEKSFVALKPVWVFDPFL